MTSPSDWHSTERNVHVGSSTQATSDINPQLKVMDFPFSW